MEEGETAQKIAYIEDLTPEILARKAKEKGLKLLKGGFKETPDAENLYGVTYGIYERAGSEMTKKGSLYPHVPKSKTVQFPHTKTKAKY